MNELLMKIVVDTVALFATCDDDTVDPDVAVTKLEFISFSLQKLNDYEKDMFLKFIKKMADEEAARSGENSRTEFYVLCPKTWG